MDMIKYDFRNYGFELEFFDNEVVGPNLTHSPMHQYPREANASNFFHQ